MLTKATATGHDSAEYEQPVISIAFEYSAKDVPNSFTYTYDDYNRLVHMQSAGHEASYTYDANGLRTSKTINNITQNHVWDGMNMVKDGDTVYHYGLDLISSSIGDYYIHDGHGDVVALTDNTGKITQRYNYDAFGTEYNSGYTDTNPFRFCGEYYDTESDLIYLRARYYDPSSGRFTTQDPIKDGLNWYVYCENNPIKYIDPFGLVVTEWDYLNCSPSDIKKLQGNDAMWRNGTDEDKKIAAESSRKIRQKYLSSNEQLLDNGYVVETFKQTYISTGASGSLHLSSTVTYERLYKEKAIYIKVIDINISTKTSSGFYVKKMYVNSGQGGIVGAQSYKSDVVNKGNYSFTPNWGMVIDDNGAGSTVIGTNVTIEAHRGTSNTLYTLQNINQLYYKETIYNGQNYVQGIDFYDTMFDIILGGGR